MLNSQQQRELVYLVTVDEIKPIPGRDRVECAVVGGWTIMTRKDQFHPGDVGIYFEVDSKVPEKEPFMFLAPKHFKIKIQKYKTPEGQFWSQGLLMHPDDFGWEVQVEPLGGVRTEVVIDDNGKPHYPNDESRFLTAELGVVYANPSDNSRKAAPADKYKRMAQRNGKLFSHQPFRWLMKHNWGKKLLFIFFGRKRDSKTGFPTHFPFVHKSDEERIENCLFFLQDKTPWIKTTKIDGTSSTYILERKPFNRTEFYVCSRNVRQLTPDQKTFHSDNVYWSVEYKYHIRDFLEDMLKQNPDWNYVAIQGETAGVGEDGGKIQGDPHQFGELRFFGFNFIDSKQGRWNSIDAKNIVEKYNIDWVPIIDEKYILPDIDKFEEFKLSADGPCEAPGSHGMREGYVYRNLADPNKSFKNVSRKYLLKH